MRQPFLTFLFVAALAGCASHPNTQASPAPDAVVYLHGHEVHTKGAYSWHAGITVQDLIRAAGGLSVYADHSTIRVTHVDGAMDRYKYAEIVSGRIKDPVLQPGDKVYVVPPFP